MDGPRDGLSRRGFLAAGVASGSAGSWPALADLRADASPPPTVEWTFRVPDDTAARTKLVTRESVYVESKTGIYALSTDGETRWTRSLDGGRPDVRRTGVGEETLYVETAEGRIYAVDRVDGRIRWQRGDDGGTWRSPVAAGRTVFAIGDRLRALSAVDGRTRWQYDTAGDGVMDPIVGAGMVVVGTVDGPVHAVDAATGVRRWTFGDSDEGAAYPVALLEPGPSDTVVVLWDRTRRRLSAVDAADGSVRWRFRSATDSFVLPGVVTDRTVFVLDGDSLVALAPADGTTRWRFRADASLEWLTNVDGGAVYVTDEAGTLHARSRRDGTGRWTFRTGTDDGVVTNRTPGNVLAVDDWNGTLYGLDAGDGRVRWAFEYGDETAWFPQVVGQRAYLGTQSGTVYALDRPPATSLNQLRRETANADATALAAPLVVGTLLGGLLAAVGSRFDGPADEPATWNDFELLDRVGEGPTGEVHRARTPDGEVVALKQFDGVPGDDFADALETWVGLDGDCVLGVHEWGTDPDPWVAMAYVDGGSLADHLDDFDRRRAVEVVSTVAEIVHRAHREGVAHGRLHPGNVLFSESDEVLVSDWLGAATRAGVPRGYAAPEERADGRADEEVGVAVDVYQLGALGVEALTGEPPTDGEFDGDGLPDELADVLETALASDPDERYDSALAFRDMFRWAGFR